MSGVLIALVLVLLPAASVCDGVGAAAAAGGGTPVAPRTLYFRNECKETVRLGATGGNTNLPCSGDGSDASCPAGTQCGLGQCYFALTEPEGGWDLAPGATRTVELPKPIYTQTWCAVCQHRLRLDAWLRDRVVPRCEWHMRAIQRAPGSSLPD